MSTCNATQQMLHQYQPVPMRPSRARRPGLLLRSWWLRGRRMALPLAICVVLLLALQAGIGKRSGHQQQQPVVDLARVHAALQTAAGGIETEAAVPGRGARRAGGGRVIALAGPPGPRGAGITLAPAAAPRAGVRVHHAHAHLVRCLLHALRYQANADKAPATVDFALVATEPRGMNVMATVAAEAWAQGYKDAYSVHLPDTFWAEAKAKASGFRCTLQKGDRGRGRRARRPRPALLPQLRCLREIQGLIKSIFR